MYYQIKDSLVECSNDDIFAGNAQYVALLTSKEWKEQCDKFNMGIDLDLETSELYETKAVVNFDSLTGTLLIPSREDISGRRHTISFALDERGIVIIDDGEYAGNVLKKIQKTKKWHLPSLERLIYDFLENTIADDTKLLERIELELNKIEDSILSGEIETFPQKLNNTRGDLLDLRVHYEQLIDLSQEFEENENGFFQPENLRYFKLLSERIIRLKDTVSSLREYIVQLRDLIQSQLSEKQNKIMTLLTIVTSIC